jgi:hypothetical protein
MQGNRSKRKEILLVLVSSLLVLIIVELILRTAPNNSGKIKKYGWAVPNNAKYSKMVEDSPGKKVKVEVEYFDYGFKRWGDSGTQKVKMFIIGDSYAQMDRVSNGQEWYSFLEKELNLELFVYGVGGHGSLQEYMVIDDFIDKIRPDLIILQFCDNDYENNLYELDLLVYPYNSNGFRPYLENGEIIYRQPARFYALRRYSSIADRILQIYDRFMRWKIRRNREAYNKQRKAELMGAPKKEKERIRLLREEAFEVTSRIMSMIRKRSEGIPVYLFSVYFSSFSNNLAEKLAKLNNFIYIPLIQEFANAEKENICLRVVNDGHWNRMGNRIVGEGLVAYFKKAGISKINAHVSGVDVN